MKDLNEKEALEFLLSYHEDEANNTEGREKKVHELRAMDIRNKIGYIFEGAHDSEYQEAIQVVRGEIQKYIDDDQYIGRHQHVLDEYDASADIHSKLTLRP